MSHTSLKDVSICGIVCAVPKERRENAFFEPSFGKEDVEKLKNITGINSRRVSDSQTCSSDLCVASAEELLKELHWSKNEIEALIFVTQTPDYTLPATACTLQHRLGLSTSCVAFDINLGCSGYVYGLWVASTFISSGQFKKVLLLVGDTCTKFVGPEDKSTAFLFGDAGSATALVYDPEATRSIYSMGTDGAGTPNLIIPAGNFRTPSNESTRDRTTQKDNNKRSQEDLYMNGSEIFNFTIQVVPTLFKELLTQASISENELDTIVFHQANLFMLNYLAKKMKLPKEKVPISITEFGNTSSASIPLTLVTNASISINNVALLGFGVGYSWAGTVLSLSKLDVAKLIEV